MAGISKTIDTDIEGTSTAKKRFDPLEMMELRKAVLERKRTIRLRGTTFTLRYEGSSVFYKPQDGFAPCGWLTVARVENYIMDMD